MTFDSSKLLKLTNCQFYVNQELLDRSGFSFLYPEAGSKNKGSEKKSLSFTAWREFKGFPLTKRRLPFILQASLSEKVNDSEKGTRIEQ